MWCSKCGTKLPDGARFCSSCSAPVAAEVPQAPPVPAAPMDPRSRIWFQNYYRIRKKVIAVANQYWIEDRGGNCLGYTRQKLLRLKEDIPVFTDDSMSSELFRIKQEQVMDMWGTYAVMDSVANLVVGKIQRRVLSGVAMDEYFMFNSVGQQIGRVVESAGRGLARKYMPGGNLVPERVAVEFFGREVAEIKQQFKIIGDIWEVDCSRIPPDIDRRMLLGCMILMGMIERDRK